MRIGMVSSSRNIVLALKKNLILILAMTFLYAITSFAIGEIKLLPGTEGGGELRPFIFIPALAAIIFGPTVGAFSAGFGNFLIDIINDRIIQGDTLDLGNLAGFFGNFIGAALVGFISWRLKFNKDDKIFFSWKIWMRYLQNTLAAVVGMGLVTGEVIGLLRIAFEKSTWDIGIKIATSIFYSNSLFLVATLIPLQLIVGIYEKVRINRYQKSLHDSKNVTLLEEPDNPHAVIEEFNIIPGSGIDGLVKGEWSQIQMRIKNNSTAPMTFRLEINCEDRIDPSVAYTKLLNPQESDEKFFQINPFNDSKRVFTVYIKHWSPTYKELTKVSQIGMSVRYRYTYTTLTPFEHRFNLFTNFLTLCAFAVVIFNTIRTFWGDFGTSLENSREFIWALIVCGVELVLVLGWIIYKLVTVQRKIQKAKEVAKLERIKANEKKEKELELYNQQLREISVQYDLKIEQTPITSTSTELPTTTTTIEDIQETEEEFSPTVEPTIDEVATEESTTIIDDQEEIEDTPVDEELDSIEVEPLTEDTTQIEGQAIEQEELQEIEEATEDLPIEVVPSEEDDTTGKELITSFDSLEEVTEETEEQDSVDIDELEEDEF